MTVTYDDAIKWLRLMRNKAYTKKEHDLIKWIEEVVWRDNDMRNS